MKPAVANALVLDGMVIGYEVVDDGTGYPSPSDVAGANVKRATAKVELSFRKYLEQNGSISAITISKAESRAGGAPQGFPRSSLLLSPQVLVEESDDKLPQVTLLGLQVEAVWRPFDDHELVLDANLLELLGESL